MIHVITNSRQFAIGKLMSSFGLSAPFAGLNFVTTLSGLHDIFVPSTLPDSARQLSRSSSPEAQPALVIWQRGRMSEDARALRARTRDAFAFNYLRDPTNHEMDDCNVQEAPRD